MRIRLRIFTAKPTVTIAFRQRVIPALRYMICVRNPLDCAQSLGRHAVLPDEALLTAELSRVRRLLENRPEPAP